MRARILSALVLLPIAVALVIAGGRPFALGVLVMAGIAVWEAQSLFIRTAGFEPLPAWRIGSVALVALPLCAVGLHPAWLGPITASGFLLSLLGLLLSGAPARHSVAWACSLGAASYVGGLAVHMVLLRSTVDGLAWVVLACAVTWSTDIGAFFVGRQFGKRPFFQTISPKKTLEGALGGLVAGISAAIVTGMVTRSADVPILLAIGVTTSAGGQAGDLLESLLKREAGVKDSGTIIPGHGGMLDRIDSLLVVVTLVFYWKVILT